MNLAFKMTSVNRHLQYFSFNENSCSKPQNFDGLSSGDDPVEEYCFNLESVYSVHSFSSQEPLSFKEGGVRVCGDAVSPHFWCGF